MGWNWVFDIRPYIRQCVKNFHDLNRVPGTGTYESAREVILRKRLQEAENKILHLEACLSSFTEWSWEVSPYERGGGANSVVDNIYMLKLGEPKRPPEKLGE